MYKTQEIENTELRYLTESRVQILAVIADLQLNGKFLGIQDLYNQVDKISAQIDKYIELRYAKDKPEEVKEKSQVISDKTVMHYDPVTDVIMQGTSANHVNRRIVCAAARALHPKSGEIIILASPRHWDAIMHKQREALAEDVSVIAFTQGFLDNHGEFLERDKALEVAERAGQINVVRHKTGPEDKLFSEDLY